MKTRFLTAFGLAMALLVFMTTAALAAEGNGTGTLTAQGNGLVSVRGNLNVTVTGSGILVIHDLAGDAKIDVTGKGIKRQRKDKTIVYAGFDGKAVVSGSKVDVQIVGKNIVLKATGTGAFRLRGRGTFETNRGSGDWTPRFRIGAIR